MALLNEIKGKITLTTDMWTSNHQTKSYMAVTTHFVDDSWVLQNKIIRFIYVSSPHTSEILYEEIMECLLDWNIDRKLSSVTVDNCSTNNSMVNMLVDSLCGNLILDGSLFHMRCCAHIINLIVKDRLAMIVDGIERVRSSVSFWVHTQKKNEKFEETARQLNVYDGQMLSLDCCTRWNSTYFMLATALKYKAVFDRLKQRESKYKCFPLDQDWVLAKEICEKLKIFHHVIEIFSRSKYPTANLFFPKICKLKLAISEWTNSGIQDIRDMTSNMMSKFDKYWNKIHGVMAIAAVLDPQYQLKHEGEGDDYHARNLDGTSQNIEFDDFNDYDFWWKLNGVKYPILQEIARDILVIPLSSVASESAFSTSGRIVGKEMVKHLATVLEDVDDSDEDGVVTKVYFMGLVQLGNPVDSFLDFQISQWLWGLGATNQ
ncbi:zinc finger BED domain-containing protein RICESLEEPER 1-like [Benincasa hispida]|uniref:zinc finger BED domain-containing protein RICESLEEPER 1-like n=1 Tax=Benincasa hispida TaxID=102211 RepID=UPI0019019720|nr:zinc finger BED domain-containing protein RICESLEEPER 1-like [Benincasa hispida]